MLRTTLVLTVLLLLASACGGSDDGPAGMAIAETDSTTPTSATTVDAVDDTAETAETVETEPETTTGPLVDIVQPDGSAPVERSGNMVTATVAGWEDRAVPIWLVVITPGDQQYPFPSFVADDGSVAWSELFIGSDDENGADFSLVVISVEADSPGAAEIDRLVEEGGGATGLVSMPGITELARQEVVRSADG